MVEPARTPEFEAYAEASKALKYGLHDAAHSVYRLMSSGAWRDYVTPLGEHVTHERFDRFVDAEPLEGLGTDVETIRRLFRDFPRYLSDLTELLRRGGGRPGAGTGTVNNINGSTRPVGTSQEQALRQLRQSRPDLHEQVIDGLLSAHAAMVEAGFRPRTATVRLDDPAKIANTLRKKLSPEHLRQLAHLLTEER